VNFFFSGRNVGFKGHIGDELGKGASTGLLYIQTPIIYTRSSTFRPGIIP